ncbi:Acyl carrier protein [Amycolatopsis xylanica]|uniref:Acyl carrier protein n=1 Tax=Amycolatopsis xylanica TaxID=589385 RepID=A0A1H3SSG2_9PSEU|nr:acyl carrier protein [Amycolatopsis xylanica]SDZ40956.1 Acyl carrier protein [Amycolatopsis xylanica]
MSEVAAKLREVFVESLELDDDVNVETLKYRDIDAWDSVGHMALVAAIEDEFDVQFDTDQVIDMSSFKVAVDMVTQLQAANA